MMNPRDALYLFLSRRKQRKDARTRALIGVRRWCLDEAEKCTSCPDSPAYHIYRDVAAHITEEMGR